MDLRELNRKLRTGDHESMREVFERYGEDCISFIQNYSGNRDRSFAEDVMMEAMLAFFESAKAGRLPLLNNLRNYLLTACRNIYLKQKGMEKRRTENQSHLERYYYDFLGEYPDMQMENREHRKWSLLEAALEKVGDKCRQVLRLYYMDRQSMAVIAKRLGYATDKVVKTTKARCMKQLREFVRGMDTENTNQRPHGMDGG